MKRFGNICLIVVEWMIHTVGYSVLKGLDIFRTQTGKENCDPVQEKAKNRVTFLLLLY